MKLFLALFCVGAKTPAANIEVIRRRAIRPNNSQRRWRQAIWCLVLSVAGLLLAVPSDAANPAPVGTDFPLWVYGSGNPPVANNYVPYGWNILQDYSPRSSSSAVNSYLQACAAINETGPAIMPSTTDSSGNTVEMTQANAQSWIQAVSGNSNLSWWNLPEELNPSKPADLSTLADYCTYTRLYDPQRRPNYEVTVWGGTSSIVQGTSPYADVIAIEAYTPGVAVRHAVSDVVLKGIHNAGKVIGTNYLAGQKLPMAIIDLVANTGDIAYHDFWSAIASGALGIGVYNHWDGSPANISQANTAASQITGSEHLGDVILNGYTDPTVGFSILSGPPQTADGAYASINVLCKVRNGNVYVIAVNSTNQPVTASITGLQTSDASATVLFQSRSASVSGGSLTDTFPAWGVNIYKMSLQPGNAPAAPTGVSAVVSGGSQISLKWTAPAGATSYNVNRATVSGGPYQTVAIGLTSPAYSDNFGLSPTTAYYYTITAFNDYGQANSAELATATQTDTNGTWTNTAGGSWANSANWSSSAIAVGVGQTADFSTLNLTADATVTVDGARTIGNLIFGDTTPNNNWFLNTGSGDPLTLCVSSGTPTITVNNQTATINAALAGNQGFVKAGGGTLSIGGNQSVTSSAWTVNSGAMNFLSGSSIAVASGASIVLGNNSTGHTLNVAGTVANAGSLNVYSAGNLNINSGGSWTQSGGITLMPVEGYVAAQLTVNTGGTFNYSGNSTINISASSGASGSSDLNIRGGTFITGYGFNNGTSSGTGSAYLNFSNGGILTLSANISTLASTAGRPFNVQVGTGGGTINTNGFATTITQGIANVSGQTGSLTKQGAGVLTLSGANTYTGATTINGGTLAVTGSLGNSAVTVANGGTLDGVGSLSGAVAVQSGATLTAGAGGIGTLTIANTLSLAGTTQLGISKSGTTASAQSLAGMTSVTYGGTLTVTNLGGTPAVGDVFQLFSANTYGGSFSVINLPILPVDLAWNTANLPVNGSISVVPIPPAIATAAAASNSTTTSTTDNLSVLGSDTAGESNLTYTWTTTAQPSGSAAPSFSVNGTNAAKNTVVTVSQAGTYTFQVTVTNGVGGTVTSSVNVTASQTVSTVIVVPGSAGLRSAGTQQFSATANDQFGNALASQPAFSWSNSGSGAISNSGLYTAGYASGTATETATSGGVTGTASVTVTNAAPTVATAAAASPATVTGTTANLSVLGADSDGGGESNLTYNWAATALPSGAAAPAFSANGTNAAKNVTATLNASGSYVFTVTITDAGGLSTTSSVNVTVSPTVTAIAVTPATATVASGGTQQFAANATDQFGAALATQPSFTWSTTGASSINSSGLYTAAFAAGTATVTVTSGGVNGTATVTITNAGPTVATAAAASPATVTGTTTNLSVLGADSDGGGEANLTYTWAATMMPAGAMVPTYSANGTNAAKNTTVTFATNGAYTFTVTIADAGGLTVTSSVNVTVSTTGNGTWINAAGGSWPNGANWSGGIIANGVGATADFSQLNLTADATVTVDGPRTIGSLIFGDTTPSNNWILNTGSGDPLTLSVSSGTPTITVNNQTATINAVLAGNQGFTKAGNGTLVLTGANVYTGVTTVSGGTVSVSGNQTAANGGWIINSGTANFVSGSSVAAAAGKTFFLGNTSTTHSLNVAGTVANAGSLNVYSAGNLNINSGGSWTQSGGITLMPVEGYVAAQLTVNTGGTFTYNGNSAININASSGGTSSFGGSSDLNISGGTFITGYGFNNGTPDGTGSAYLNFSNGGILTLSANISTLASTAGRPFNVQVGTGGGTINTNGFATKITQGIVNFSGQTGSLTKQGAGVLTLSGANTYTGATTINGGTLAVTGSLGNSAVIAANGGTLDGVGSLSGAVTVQAGGTLTAGGGGIGTLTIKNTLSLAGTTQLGISKSGTTTSAQSLAGMTGVTYGGTLTVSNLGGTLAVGDTFQLFTASGYSGSFATINLPALSSGLAWNTSALSTNGSIQVVANAPTVATPASASPSSLIGTTTALSVLGADAAGESGLTYTWSASGPGGVTFSANGTNAAKQSNATVSQAGTYTFTVTIANATGGTVTSSTTASFSSVAGFNGSADIGSVGLTGGSSYANGVFTVSGSGADIGGSADAFQFASQTLNGDGDIRARVTSQTNTNPLAKAGVMLRETSNAGSANAMMAITPANGFLFEYRAAAGGASTTVAGPALNAAPNNWVRLTRSGTLITAYVSADGNSWTQVGTAVISMASSINAGLAVSSHDNTQTSTATIDNLTVTPFPAPWQTVDIGAPGMQGSAEYFNSIFTVKGAGNQSGTADNCRFVYQTMSGDGQITARIPVPDNTGSNARVGVEIRNDLTSSSALAGMIIDGSNSYWFQRRNATGSASVRNPLGSGTAPNIWVRVVRSGNNFSGYESADGTNWTLVKSVNNVTMGTNVYVGLVVASGSTTTLNTTVFDNITVVP